MSSIFEVNPWIKDIEGEVVGGNANNFENKNLRNWYYQMFSCLVSTLKAKTGSDSPLISELDDFSLLLQTENLGDLPNPKEFDITQTIKSAIDAVRKIFPENENVGLTISLQPSMNHKWMGHSKIIEALLRHLLLIAFTRTQKGGIFLRIEADNVAGNFNHFWLRIKMEDSGPPMQQWQLNQWIARLRNEAPLTDNMRDLSWLLSGRLFHHLGGGANAENNETGGIKLECWIPLTPYEKKKSRLVPEPDTSNTFPLNLVIAVERNKQRQKELIEIFAKKSISVFIVDDHVQALEWAKALPVAGIAINSTIPEDSLSWRFSQIIRTEGLSHIPVWVIIAHESPTVKRSWEKTGVHGFLELPLEQGDVDEFCASLFVNEDGFYRTISSQLHSDLPESVLTKLPDLTRQLARQVKSIEREIPKLLNYEITLDIKNKVHATKSAALSLGYLHMAALIAQIEYTLNTKSTFDWQLNGEIIEKCLYFACLTCKSANVSKN